MCFVTSCLRYISGKYYPNWLGFNGVIAEVKMVTSLRHKRQNHAYSCYYKDDKWLKLIL